MPHEHGETQRTIEIQRIVDSAAIKEAEALFDKPIRADAAERFLSSDPGWLELIQQQRSATNGSQKLVQGS